MRSVTEAALRATVDRLYRRATYKILLDRHFELTQKRAALQTESSNRRDVERGRNAEPAAESVELEVALERLRAEFDHADYSALFDEVNA